MVVGAAVVLSAGVRQSPDVVSIKPHLAAGQRDASVYHADPVSLHSTRTSLKDLVCTAYINDPWTCSWAVQFKGMNWIEDDLYDVEARWGQPLNTDDEIRQHLQAALADRFKLAVRHESRPVPVFRLESAHTSKKPQPATDTSKCGQILFKPGLISASCLTMDDLADVVENALQQRHVVNATGLPNDRGYQVQLQFGDDSHPESGPSIFTALPDQLGLRLVSATAQKPQPN